MDSFTSLEFESFFDTAEFNDATTSNGSLTSARTTEDDEIFDILVDSERDRAFTSYCTIA
ncbi:hypothetical protein D9619_009302 [Psilocybe cf. subviscida]|uniref:Pheromone n=1 Tax=Psilocybe cf. subviscida TaxID=2480587 RepID=A0A8H5BU03_9AGAR|nr:hypothetical protein D9619_009302 [Psilocybe cf. subviscida]